jgi:hypothetical protein
MTTTIDQLTADLSTLDTAIGVVEYQTMHTGIIRKDEYALYTHLMSDRASKQAELEEIQQNKRTIKSFIPHFKKN